MSITGKYKFEGWGDSRVCKELLIGISGTNKTLHKHYLERKTSHKIDLHHPEALMPQEMVIPTHSFIE